MGGPMGFGLTAARDLMKRIVGTDPGDEAAGMIIDDKGSVAHPPFQRRDRLDATPDG